MHAKASQAIDDHPARAVQLQELGALLSHDGATALVDVGRADGARLARARLAVEHAAALERERIGKLREEGPRVGHQVVHAILVLRKHRGVQVFQEAQERPEHAILDALARLGRQADREAQRHQVRARFAHPVREVLDGLAHAHVGRVERQLLSDEGRLSAVRLGPVVVDGHQGRLKRGRLGGAQVHRERHRSVRPTAHSHRVSVATKRVGTSCNGGLSKETVNPTLDGATKPTNCANCANCANYTPPFTPHRSSHHAFSRFTSSSSSGVKSFLMLNRERISSGLLPLISSATALHVRSSNGLMSK